MTSPEKRHFDKLDKLEAKICQAVEKYAELETTCRAHREKNRELEEQLGTLRAHNNELSKQIFELKTAKEGPAGLVEEKKILTKIDRMLEKFGELQI